MVDFGSLESRRAFLLKLGAGMGAVTVGRYVLGAGQPPGRGSRRSARRSGARKERGTIMLEELTARDFAPHVGSLFRLDAGDERSIPCELIEARCLETSRDGPSDRKEKRRRPFSVVFRAPENREIGQGIYALEHAELGNLEIFLVPIGPFPGETRLEAVFG